MWPDDWSLSHLKQQISAMGFGVFPFVFLAALHHFFYPLEMNECLERIGIVQFFTGCAIIDLFILPSSLLRLFLPFISSSESEETRH
jgi:hypothetical protein